MNEFSGTLTSRLALNILKSFQNVIMIARSDLPPGKKEQSFLVAVKATLDRVKLLADTTRTEVTKHLENPPPEFPQLLQLDSHIVTLREVLLTIIRVVRNGLHNPDSFSSLLNSGIRSTGNSIKDIIKVSKEIESFQNTGSVLDSIGVVLDSIGMSRSNFSGIDLALPPPEEVTQLPSPSQLSGYTYPSTLLADGSFPDRQISDEIPASNVVDVDPDSGINPASFDKAIELFNQKWSHGIQYLLTERLIGDDANAIAQFLVKHNDKLSKVQLGELLAGLNDSDVELMTAFTRLMNFKGESFDDSLRKYLTKFMLPGEAQKISRMMEVFAAEFLSQNPGIFPNEDVAFVLAFSLIMLNTDAHNPAIQQKDKMTKEQFIWNNRGTWVDGTDPPKELLSDLYDKIVLNEIKMHTKGDPDKRGWMKSIHAGSIRDGKRWFILKGNELTWYKSPPLTGRDDELKGKIILEYLNVKIEDEPAAKFVIISTLPKNVEFMTYERGKQSIVSTKKIVICAENPATMKSWVQDCMNHVTFNQVPQIEEKKGKRGKKNDKSNRWRNSVLTPPATQRKKKQVIIKIS